MRDCPLPMVAICEVIICMEQKNTAAQLHVRECGDRGEIRTALFCNRSEMNKASETSASRESGLRRGRTLFML